EPKAVRARVELVALPAERRRRADLQLDVRAAGPPADDRQGEARRGPQDGRELVRDRVRLRTAVHDDPRRGGQRERPRGAVHLGRERHDRHGRGSGAGGPGREDQRRERAGNDRPQPHPGSVYLTLPAVSPDTRWRSMAANSATTGTIAI